MTDLAYRSAMRDIKQKILNNEYEDMRLPDERSLNDYYHVGRSSAKRTLGLLAQRGIVFKKRGNGTFIDLLYLRNQALLEYEGSSLGIIDSFSVSDKKQSIELSDYQVIKVDEGLRQDLFLKESDSVYQIKRSRLLDDQPFLIEIGFIPIKITPELNPDILEGSLSNYLEGTRNKTVTWSFLTVTVGPSTLEDQSKLMLAPNEPVGVMEGIFFLDDGAPFEVSNMRIHYKYTKYNTSVNLSQE